MDKLKLPLSTVSAATALPATFDSVSLQAAYLALQMNQLGQHSQTMLSPLQGLQTTCGGNGLLKTIAPSLGQEVPLDAAQQSSIFAAQHAAAAAAAASIPVTTVAATPLTFPSFDMALMQMQTVAAGLSPFNMLQPVDLLTSNVQFSPHIPDFATSNRCLEIIPNAACATLPAESSSLINGSSTSPASATDGAVHRAFSLPGTPAPRANGARTPTPVPRCYSMGKRHHTDCRHKRAHPGEMTVLRALCNDDDQTDETTFNEKKRANGSLLVNNEKQRRLLAAEAMASISVSNGTGEAATNPPLPAGPQEKRRKTSGDHSVTTLARPEPTLPRALSSGYKPSPPVGDPNSPNRHHPLNHRPPAMEARFLECMAAIALHSHFPLATATNDEQSKENSQPEEMVAKPSQEHGADNKNGGTSTASDDQAAVLSPSPAQSQGAAGSEGDKKGKDRSLAASKLRERKVWSTSAIDDDLCHEFESYKGTDVPMIHAYVIPSREEPKALDERKDKPLSFHSVPSLAVPVPILNILLDRILQTMLEP